MMSQREVAPFFAGAEGERAARRRRRLRIVVDGQFERAEMALGGADRALHHREFGDARRRDIGRRLDQHGDVEMILEQVGRLDRGFVAAVDQDHALAVEAHERDVGGGLGGGRDQRRHLRAGRPRILRPARGLADVDEADVGVLRDFGEQRRFLRAGDGERLAARGGLAERLQLQRGRADARSSTSRRGSRASPRPRRAAWCRRRSRSGRCAGLRPSDLGH